MVLAVSAQAQAQPQAQAQTSPPPVTAPPAPPPPVESWVARAGVELAALDKITARVSPLAGRVGQPMHFGTLTVTVRSCIVRGPDQPADQAAFLDVTDSREANFSFHGWMLLSAPGVSVLEHPVYDIRLTGCRP
jgi:hypothetical protein